MGFPPPLLPPVLLLPSLRGPVTGCGCATPCSVYPRLSVAVVVAVFATGRDALTAVLLAGLAVILLAGVVAELLVEAGLVETFVGVLEVLFVVAGRAVVVVGVETDELLAGRAVVVGVLEAEEVLAGRAVVVVGLEVEGVVVGLLVVVMVGREILCCAF